MIDLYVRDGDTFTQAPPGAVLDSARHLLAEHFRPGAPILKDPQLVETFLTARLAEREHEVFALICLDCRHHLIEYLELTQGTLDLATVHPREVVKAALKSNAAGVILVHNHPSGVPEPTAADVELTRRLKTALAMVDIRVLDHVIVGATTTSFAKRGLLF